MVQLKKSGLKQLKIIVIYVYLLITIVVIQYKIPGLIDYNKVQNEIDKQLTLEEFISGGYLEDKTMFNTDDMYFPVAIAGDIEENLYYIDSFGYDRTYGGERTHEGCDIMTHNNLRGEYPVISVCDGTVEQIGWLELGGYRIGIRSDTGVYYYYAHLYRYDETIMEGMRVYAGQVIGYIGDTGYSKVEGTTGNFDVHLHFGIYLNDENGNEYAINPYFLLKKLEASVLKYSFKNQ